MPSEPMFVVEREGQVLVVTVSEHAGSFSDVDATEEFGALLRSIEEPGLAGIVIDLKNLPWFGSLLLETFRNLWTRLRPRGQRLALCRVSEVGRDILRLARFDTLWPICESRDEAVRTVAGSSGG